MKMNDIRYAIREERLNKQQEIRESLLNRNRNIEYNDTIKNSCQDDVIKLANELKKTCITYEKLLSLKEMLLQGKGNITCFLNVNGALDALVKALSGQSSKLQIGAAYCLCNLSLAELPVKVIKTAGPYLILHLQGMNTYLIEACLWTLGNLSSHNEKGVRLLKSQGALPILSHLLNHSDDNISIAASYALSHLVYTGYDVLTPEDFRIIIGPTVSLYKTRHASVAYLMSVMSANSNCQLELLQEKIHILSLNFLISSLNENILQSAWYLRIIGNLVTENTGQAAIELLTYEELDKDGEEIKTLLTAVEYIMKSGQIFLVKECCWMLGNLINHNNERIPSTLLATKILDTITTPVRYFLIK